MTPYNVVLFGESGCGKSSVVNMLLGFEAAPTSSGARGCTFNSAGYDIRIDGARFRIHDTAGLEEGEEGRVPKADAITQLYSLLRTLDGGVSLLVFCMKAPRIKESAKHNWLLFHEIMCKGQVPIAIVVTGLEQEDNMDSWWESNEDTFRRYGMHSHGHACVTAIRGRLRKGEYTLQAEYDESKAKVEQMIKKCYKEQPWRMQRIQWLGEVIYDVTYKSRWCQDPKEIKTAVGKTKGAVDELVSKCGMSEKEAEELGQKLDQM
ncbi:hypothetical protein NLJ89_g9663 [Agrocybe chaxingu]|uniref:G domain-containing protein n=1 Tax=Agrocybe chaxingu TaxID=84603 RepID=A0A9W8JSA5_9AGAR|nr:hypothetical protein NLJ89_g9663 [Agrocybe chaxingu]